MLAAVVAGPIMMLYGVSYLDDATNNDRGEAIKEWNGVANKWQRSGLDDFTGMHFTACVTSIEGGQCSSLQVALEETADEVRGRRGRGRQAGRQAGRQRKLPRGRVLAGTLPDPLRSRAPRRRNSRTSGPRAQTRRLRTGRHSSTRLDSITLGKRRPPNSSRNGSLSTRTGPRSTAPRGSRPAARVRGLLRRCCVASCFSTRGLANNRRRPADRAVQGRVRHHPNRPSDRSRLPHLPAEMHYYARYVAP